MSRCAKFPAVPSYSSCLSALNWTRGAIPGTDEAEIPDGYEPFALARELRERDPSASYACEPRGAAWFVVCFPSDPPQPKPLYRCSVRVSLRVFGSDSYAAPLYSRDCEKLEAAYARLCDVLPCTLSVRASHIERIEPAEPLDEFDALAASVRPALSAFAYALAPMRRHGLQLPSTETIAERVCAALAEL